MVKTYRADRELAVLVLEAAKSGEPVRIDIGEEVYEAAIRRVATRSEAYDPERAREALWASFGVLGGIDADALIEELKAEREQAGRDFSKILEDHELPD